MNKAFKSQLVFKTLNNNGGGKSVKMSSSSSSSTATTSSTTTSTTSVIAVDSDKETYKKLSQESKQMIDRIIRVDHAGEFGADRIYAGQMAVLGRQPVGVTIKHMWEQEKEHLKKFEELIPKYRARPTALLPLWNVAGWALGAGTALLGKEAAMACTVAVETVISDHYNNQLRELLEKDADSHTELLEVIKKFRDEEQDHHDIGIQNEAEKFTFYKPLTETIKAGCKAAVYVAERV